MSFGSILRERREAAGLSQSELARRSGTSIDTLRNWEQGRSLPKIDAVTRLARALGISLDLLALEGSDLQGDAPPSTVAPPPPAAKKPRGRAKGK